MGVFESLRKTSSSGGVFSRLEEERKERRREHMPLSPAYQALGDPRGVTGLLRDRVDQIAEERRPPETPQILPRDPTKTYLTPEQVTDPEVRREIERYRPYTGTPKSPADQFVSGLANTVLLGVPNALTRGEATRDTNTPFGIAGQLAGEALGFGVASRATRPLTDVAVRRVVGESTGKLGQKVAEGAIRGGIAEGAFATAQELADVAMDTRRNENESIGQRLGNVALRTGLGAGLEAGAIALGTGVRRALEAWRNRGNAPAQVEEILALPAPRERGNVNVAQTPEVIPMGAAPTRVRVGTKVNPYRVKFENLITEANRLEQQGYFTPGREYEQLESLWSQIAGPEDPGLDRLIELAYPRQRRISPDALERGRLAQIAGVGPNVERNVLRRETQAVEPTPLKIPEVQPAPSMRPPEMLRAEPEPRPVDQEVIQAIQEVSQPRIRDRVYNYLDEAERAARERIARSRNRISSTPVDIYRDYAIIMAAKLGKGVIKAADFTEELVREFGEQLRPHAQRIYRMALEELRVQARKATKEAEDAIRFNQGGGDATTFRSKISRDVKKRKMPASQRWEQLRSQFVDDLASLERLERSIRGRLASAEDSLYKSARLFKGAPSKAHQIVRTRFEPIAQRVEQAGFTMDDLGDYALAVHARDVNSKYMKSGFTDAEIDDVIRKYGTPEMEQARQELIRISDDMLQELVDSGVISNDLAETLRVRWPNYVPLFRHFDDDVVQFESGLSNALANVSVPIKQLKGSEREVIDPIENMVKNIFKTVNAAERNRVAQQLAKLANEPGAESFIRKLGPNEKVGRKNVVNVKIGGKDVKYEVDPEVYKAMMNLDQESSNAIIRILQKPASVLRAGATLTPEFSLRNPMRDILHAYVVSKSGFNPLIDFPIGLIEAIKGRRGNSQLYRQWVEDMGDFGNIISMDRKLHREALEKVLKQPPSKKFVNIINGRSLLGLLRAISDTTESATKLGEYRAALRSGASRAEAAYRSRDIMDFARAGSSVRQANKIIAFLNANIQGKSKLLRSIKENPIGTTTRALVSVTIPTIAAFILQKNFANEEQRQTIDEAPDWMKDTFWLIPIPGTNVVARIPKPFDLAPLFSNLPERALQYVYDNDREAFEGFVSRSLGDMALPVQISGLWPIIEGMANYSFFRDAPIIPRREQELEYREQYDPVRTSETAKALARVMEYVTGGEGMFRHFSSPRIMENTIRGFTAGLGTYATNAIDAILKGVGAAERPPAPEKRLEQQPLLKAFTVDPLSGGQTLDRYYEQKEKLTRERNTARLRERPFDKETQYQIFNRSGQLISKINSQIRTIEADMNLTPSEKRRRIEELSRQRLDIARRALQAAGGQR